MSNIGSELGLIHEDQVAEFRKVKKLHLRNERSRGLGPPYTKIGNQIFYPLEGLRGYIKENTVTPKRPRTLIDGKVGT
jgi:hypothetical protein